MRKSGDPVACHNYLDELGLLMHEKPSFREQINQLIIPYFLIALWNWPYVGICCMITARNCVSMYISAW
jgi:hypothetical protein